MDTLDTNPSVTILGALTILAHHPLPNILSRVLISLNRLQLLLNVKEKCEYVNLEIRLF